MRDAYGTTRALGGAVLTVTRDPPPQARALAGELGLPFPVLSDEAGAAFRAYGLARGVRPTLRPGLLLPYLRAAARWGLHPPGRDVWQLGGDFVLDREGRVALAHPSQHPRDHAPLERLLGAVARHHAAVVRGVRVRLRPPQPGEAVPEEAGGLLFVAETAEGPAGAVLLSWPEGTVRVLRRDPGRWDERLEAEVREALAGYVRAEWGVLTAERE